MNWLSRVEKMTGDQAFENAFVVSNFDSVLIGRKGTKSLHTIAIRMLLHLTFDSLREFLESQRLVDGKSGEADKTVVVQINFSKDKGGTEKLFSRLYAADPLLRINAIKGGLPALLPSLFALRMGISKERMYGTIGLPRATVERKVKEDEVLTPEESSRVLGIARLIGQAQAMVEQSGAEHADFDAPTWVASWLDSYLPALQAKPASLMDTTEGQALVANLLARAQSGAYS